MTGCEQVLDLISLRLDGPLDPQDQMTLDEHLNQCPSCRAMAADLEGLHSACAGLDETPPPEGFAQGVLDRIAAETAQGTAHQGKIIPLLRRPALRRLTGLAACALLMVGAAHFLLPSAPGQTGVPEGPVAMPASSAPMPADAAPAPAAFGADNAAQSDGADLNVALPRAQPYTAAGGENENENAQADYLILLTTALGAEPDRVLLVTLVPVQEAELEWTALGDGLSYRTVTGQRLDALLLELPVEDYDLIETGSGGPNVVLLSQTS